MELRNPSPLLLLVFTSLFSLSGPSFGIRIPDPTRNQASSRPVKVAVFALGSFWRSEAAFGCIPGVVRTSVGYSGGSKSNPEFRNLGDHAECVQVEYDLNVIQYKQLLDVFWASHDSRQVFGQGPDVSNQYRSIIFTNGTLEARLAAASKEREQTKSRNSIVTTQIQHLGAFHPAESDHQLLGIFSNVVNSRASCVDGADNGPCFLHSAYFSQMVLCGLLIPDFKRLFSCNQKLIGNMPDEELISSSLAAKLNGYAAEVCPPEIQKKINVKIDDILKNGWPVLRNI